MTPNPDAQRVRGQMIVWWTIWFSLLMGLGTIYSTFRQVPMPQGRTPNLLIDLMGLVPLFISIIIRWLVLPRFSSYMAAFVMFIAGLALAEMCGMLGIFLGGPYRK